MNRQKFKRKLERHKNQTRLPSKTIKTIGGQVDASIRYLQKGFEDLQKSNYEFYEFIESNYFNLEERLSKLERKVDKIP